MQLVVSTTNEMLVNCLEKMFQEEVPVGADPADRSASAHIQVVIEKSKQEAQAEQDLFDKLFPWAAADTYTVTVSRKALPSLLIIQAQVQAQLSLRLIRHLTAQAQSQTEARFSAAIHLLHEADKSFEATVLGGHDSWVNIESGAHKAAHIVSEASWTYSAAL